MSHRSSGVDNTFSQPRNRPRATFDDLGVAAEITEALDKRGIHTTTPIQELTLPLGLDGTDIIGQAHTGTGKTLGFGVPLLDRLFDSADVPEPNGTPHALVVVPTRELCLQVCDDLTAAAANLPLTVTAIYGGAPYEPQVKRLRTGVDVVVGTPGRLLDLSTRGDLTLDEIAILVLDEADEMLDLGFLPDIEKILSALTHDHQTMLFSATMPGQILTMARTFMHKPVHIRAEEPDTAQTNENTRQVIFQAHQMDKVAVTARVLQAEGRRRTIIFTRTKRSAARLAQDLAERGFSVAAVHGDLGQKQREESLNAFRSDAVEILVATDVAARGIDVEDVTHVINYQTPDDPLTYVHRIGRTGRAGHSGIAVTLVGYDELPKWQAINDELNLDLPEPPQWFSTSEPLYDALDIPRDATDVVGLAQRVIGATLRRHDPRVDNLRSRARGRGGHTRGQRGRSDRLARRRTGRRS